MRNEDARMVRLYSPFQSAAKMGSGRVAGEDGLRA